MSAYGAVGDIALKQGQGYGGRRGVSVYSTEIALDGSNPTPVTTPFRVVTSVAVSLKGTAAPGVGTSIVTYNNVNNVVNLYGWKVTGAGDTTLIASTGTETVSVTVYGYR